MKKVDPLMGGDKILDKLGLPSVFGDKYGIGGPGDAEAAYAAGSETAPVPESLVGEETMAAREAQRKRMLAAAGLGGNVLTGAGGLSGVGGAPGSMRGRSVGRAARHDDRAVGE